MVWALAAFAFVTPRVGTVIFKSCRVKPGSFNLAVSEGAKSAGDETIPTFRPAIEVRGDGITVDFSGSVLRGSLPTATPDQRRGLGILVDGNNVTIKNAHVHGYRVALMARHATGLRIVNCDFSNNWKQHLKSTTEREDLSDWQSYHHNEHDEWLRYGAAISLWDCNGFEVRATKAEGGQCGLMLTRCEHGKIWNNDFSFLSGLGIGLYRSSENRIMHNRIDWDVRGFSYGVYNRGQDSAGILVFEQSSRNVVAYNSVTHGGDGFFLWAGQQTMDSGKGGCNDNLVYCNDFSGAPTNGIEATFSRNRFIDNRVDECWHGVWDGYSYDTLIQGNFLGDSEIGIATEHGQGNRIYGNFFNHNKTAIRLWADPQQDPGWGYAKSRDTRSENTLIEENQFLGNRVTLSLRNSIGSTFIGNTVAKSKIPFEGDLSSPFPSRILNYKRNLFDFATSIPKGADRETNRVNRRELRAPKWNPWRPSVKGLQPPLKGGQDPFLARSGLRGWRAIFVDEWGPYDFKRPLLTPRDNLGMDRKRFEILGPKGRWRLVAAEGASHLSAKEGKVPGFLDVNLPPSAASVKIVLQYRGLETTDFRGIVTPAGRPVTFQYSRFFAPVSWDVKFFKWSESENRADPHSNPKDFAKVMQTPPIKELKTNRLDLAGGSLVPGLPSDHYATLAEGSFSVGDGEYTIDLTTDDGARVWLDGKPLIQDAWHYQGPTSYPKKVHLTKGEHRLRVEHFQIDGYAELKLELRRGP